MRKITAVIAESNLPPYGRHFLSSRKQSYERTVCCPRLRSLLSSTCAGDKLLQDHPRLNAHQSYPSATPGFSGVRCAKVVRPKRRTRAVFTAVCDRLTDDSRADHPGNACAGPLTAVPAHRLAILRSSPAHQGEASQGRPPHRPFRASTCPGGLHLHPWHRSGCDRRRSLVGLLLYGTVLLKYRFVNEVAQE